MPSLFGEFVYDDTRFIETNPAIQHLSPAGMLSYFTDPKTVSTHVWQGIYRPLRTLEFAIDWAVSGGAPWFFHLRSMIWHVLGSLLVLSLFRRLAGAPSGLVPAAAWCGALLHALHPVHTECVAWISSRGDLLCAILFLAALCSHLDGHRWRAAGLLAVALLAKEMAVVFVGVAFLADLSRRDQLRFRWYGLYAAMAAGFTALWIHLASPSDAVGLGQASFWWGGSFGLNLATMAKGFLYYGRLLFLPINLSVGYHLPARAALGAGTIVSIVLVLALVGGALAASRRTRFALGWFFVTIFPVSNLVIHMVIPTTERFLLIPAMGVCFAAGALLARTRLSLVVFACFFALTFARTFDWRTDDTLWTASLAVTESPSGLLHRSYREIERAEHTGLRADAEKVLATTDAFFRYYIENIQIAGEGVPGAVQVSPHDAGPMLLNQAKAYYLLGRYEEAYRAAVSAARIGDLEEARRMAEDLRERMR